MAVALYMGYKAPSEEQNKSFRGKIIATTIPASKAMTGGEKNFLKVILDVFLPLIREYPIVHSKGENASIYMAIKAIALSLA